MPSLINYQGRLSASNGVPLGTADYQLTFRIFDASTGGTLIWGPQVFDGLQGTNGHGLRIPVVQGYFNVMLGPTDVSNRDLSVAFNAANRFVEIQVSNNTAVLPRQWIVSAPYALNSLKLSGADWSAVFGTNDPVNGRIPTTKLATNGTIIAQAIGIGVTNPARLIDMSGNGGAVELVMRDPRQPPDQRAFRFNNVGTFLAIDAVNDALTGGLNIINFLRNGTVGIGTASPSFGNKLVAYDTAHATIASQGPECGFSLSDLTGSNAWLWQMRSDAGGANNDLKLLRYTNSVYAGITMQIQQSSGNVGVNISNPTNKLHVVGGATFASGDSGANQCVVWTPGNGVWTFTSDRNTKENIVPLDPAQVLEKLVQVPVSEWNYIGYSQRHIGPMAQDFHEEFPLNDDDKSLNELDLHGVALAAIQGVNLKFENILKEKEAEIARLKAKEQELEARLRRLEE